MFNYKLRPDNTKIFYNHIEERRKPSAYSDWMARVCLGLVGLQVWLVCRVCRVDGFCGIDGFAGYGGLVGLQGMVGWWVCRVWWVGWFAGYGELMGLQGMVG